MVIPIILSSGSQLLAQANCWFLGNDAERRKLAQIRKYDLDMDILLHDVGTAEEGDNDYGDDEAGESDEFLLESETGARLTPHFSISLLYR